MPSMELPSRDDEAAAATTTIEVETYGFPVRLLDGDPSVEVFLLWALNDPTSLRQNAFVRQSAQSFSLDICGRNLNILQSPSSMSTPGVTGAVLWDSGVVLGKFLEHAVDTGRLVLQGKRVVELGSGCGFVGIAAALLGADATLTDLPDRLRLLKKNVEANVEGVMARGSAKVCELTWGDNYLEPELLEPSPDFILGSDVIYDESAVSDLLRTLSRLCGARTIVFLSGELRNDAIIELFLGAAMEDFLVASVDRVQWHPEYNSNRVTMFLLIKKNALS